MAMDTCLPGLVSSGQIPADKAEAIRQRYNVILGGFSRSYDPETAAALATEATLKILQRDATQSKRVKLKQVATQARLWKDVRAYGAGLRDGEPVNPKAAIAVMQTDSFARYADLSGQHDAVRGRLHATMDKLLAEHRKTLLGNARNKVEEDDMLRAAFGEKVDSVNARELAEVAQKGAELARQMFNAAGGHIGKIDNWGWVQTHSPKLVQAVSFEEYKAFLMPLLDRERMIDRETAAPFSDFALTTALKDMYETIRQDGANRLRPGAPGGKSLANRHAEERFLHFANADAWLQYNERFGAAGPFESMMAHIDRMSRDIAAMQVLGPNPDASVRWLGDMVRKDAERLTGDKGKAVDAANAASKRMARMFDEYMGRNTVPESRRLAMGFSAFRAIQTSAKLGTAIISAVGDQATQAFTRRFNGLPIMSTVTDWLKLMAPGSIEDRKFAVRRGLIAEDWANGTAAMHRLTGEELTGEFSRRLANFTLRASGLSRHTDVARHVFGMEVLSTMTDHVGKSFDQLDASFARMLDRYGLNAPKWDRIRAQPLVKDRGAEWVDPLSWDDTALGDAVLRMIHTEMDFAVPTVDLRTRTTINSVGTPGTWSGEAARSAFLFKSFGLTVLNTHGRRMMEQADWRSAAMYGASLTAWTTVAGAVAIQLKALVQGKEPEPMGTPGFVGRAMVQGGGWGIFGDFAKASENRFGGGWAETLAGPGVQTLSNVGDLTLGNLYKTLDGNAQTETDFWHDTLRIMRQEVPVASSLWYVRPIYDRMILNQMDRWIDPDHDENMATLMKKASDNGSPYFLPPDPTLDDARLPNLGQAFTIPAEDD